MIDDALWPLIEPLLPAPKPRRKKYPGRLSIENRAALNGILFVLKTGVRWSHLPASLGFGSGATCWQRLREWQKAGVWQERHEVLLARLRGADQIDSHTLLSIRRRGEPLGRAKNWAEPKDRTQPVSKHHILVDANGIPTVAILSGANRNDVTQLLPLVDSIAPIRGARGRPIQKPKAILADRGYDSDPHRQVLRERGIKPIIARRRTGHGSGLREFRCVVERTRSWLHNFRRLRIRFERRADIHETLLKFACSLVRWNSFRYAEKSF
ncbi:IS5 family transposase [Paraburkholderia bannensis]|uniref:IS5 family transposase n=1 Tax=Paraburkholderia bannensis TaxID=765414 RepID=UPI002AB6AB14|nr:IS5 family transposase [Paraburkholderia bannensis]